MKVLIIGSGGREHAIAWKLHLSPLVSKVYCAPGNGGTVNIAENVPLNPLDIINLAEFAETNMIDLTVVGPETYLAQGIVDLFRQKGLKIYGPTKDAARLETSKIFAKDFMKKYAIPSAKFETFYDATAAKAYINQIGAPIVVKADGLAAGKGVVVAFEKKEAIQAIDEIMTRKVYGEAGAAVVIEEYLDGEEVSLLAFCDGKTAVPMLPVQDHKRIGNGDTGPNTGGMGTYTPTSVFSPEIANQVNQEILDPTIRAMQQEGTPFTGTLFIGLMLTKQGPKVVEYNVRFGDPETQAVLPLLQADLAEVFLAAVNGNLNSALVKWQTGVTSVCVVAASGGYPGKYQDGKPLIGLEQVKDSSIFHAGTKLDANDQLVTTGGRVLNIVHQGRNIREAVDGVYRDLKNIIFDGMYFRTDIGQRELNRFESK